ERTLAHERWGRPCKHRRNEGPRNADVESRSLKDFETVIAAEANGRRRAGAGSLDRHKTTNATAMVWKPWASPHQIAQPPWSRARTAVWGSRPRINSTRNGL